MDSEQFTLNTLARHTFAVLAGRTSRIKQGLLAVLYLAAHVDWYAHDDDRDGDARYEGDDHRGSQQHAHLPEDLSCLRPRLLTPKCTS